MKKIVLRKVNVVKEVASEEAAVALEMKGFVRDGAKSAKASGNQEDLQKLVDEYKKELSQTQTMLADADKKIEALTQELAGTKEQLEAAIKKNAAAEKKK